ncbi:leucine-rich repeat-containing protein 51-like [Mastacembelus armatus]|uniref:leucine-rich repeat-containing protein 51-like n=1 Tax=Mastacembelus armatus TaxID=205130 RepID=UPI000E4564F4|nr:leucine-rich repeat-containing protein 51-like [Mastacembelus armatus]
MYGPPVDLSYKDISSLSGALFKVPRTGIRPLKTNSENKYLSRSLRLNNNSITEVSGLHYIVNHFLAEPLNLGWLDLSFNKITCIDPMRLFTFSSILCELRELRVLYFHGNSIWNLSDVDKLGALPLLHTITLHGNAIEKDKGYRYHVISALPQLKSMDFSAVTNEERVLAKVWQRQKP